MTSRAELDLAGRVIVAGFEGTSLPADLAAAADRGALGGLVLFKRNVEDHLQVAALLGEARKRAPAGRRPLSAVDQGNGYDLVSIRTAPAGNPP